jgi:DNA replication protein DnaC
MSECATCGGAGWLRTGDGSPAVPCRCTLKRQAEARAKELREASGVAPALFDRMTFAAYHPERAVKPVSDVAEAKRLCEEYAASPRGWLVLSGGYGTGKTHLAYAIAGDLLRRSVPVYAASVPEMLGMIRNGYSDDQGVTAEARLKALRQVEVLVLDDWGTERGSDWVSETMFTVLNSRYNDRRATVITTNLTPQELARKDARLASRMLDVDVSRVIVLAAGDYRQRRG